MRRAWPNDSYRRNFQKYRDGRLYFGLSPKYNLHRCGKRLIVRYHGAEASPRWRRSHSGIPMPSGHLVRAPCTDALFSHLLSFVGVACEYRPLPLSALDATSFSLDHHPRCQCGCTALLPFAVRWVSYVPRTPAKSRLLRTGPFFHLHFVIKRITLLVCQKSMPSKFHLPGTKRST